MRTAIFGQRWAASILACLVTLAFCGAQAFGTERTGRLRPLPVGPEPLLFSRSEIGLGTLYPRHLDVMQDYVAAMTLYRLSPPEGGLKERVLVLDWVGTDGLPDPFRLVWKTSNGNLVARIGKGLFRISHGNYRANWFHDLDCRLLNWSGGEMDAAVSCSDGQDRRMTVPGSGLLMIDDDRYQRVFPMVASPADIYVEEEPGGAEGVDPNAAEGGETIQ